MHSLSFAEIDLSALLFNLRQVQRCIPPGCQILAVVKADAYGHGAIEVARTLLNAGVTKLGVAWLQEGIQLRQAGIHQPILVLGGVHPEEAEEAVRFNLTPVVYDPSQLVHLDEQARAAGRQIGVHLKVDTGMGRLGFASAREIDALLEVYKNTPGVLIEGLATHMSEDGMEDRPFTHRQLSRFREFEAQLARAGVNIPIRHTANSALTLDLPATHFNLVRPGIALYGYLPSKRLVCPIPLQPVMQVKTRIIHLKKVPRDTPLSYGRTFTTRRESLIGVLPIGYADGFPRALSNRGEVLVRGRRVPVVGRVCMDMTLVDLTGLDEVRPDDEAVIIGSQGQERITAEEIADRIGTIHYEILSKIGIRVRRLYKKQEKSPPEGGDDALA